MNASKFLTPSLRTFVFTRPAMNLPLRFTRNFQTSRRLLETPAAALPLRRPVGAFRGGLFGFLSGATLAGAGVYYYILEEYKVSNELLTEDIYVRVCI
ncbi:MAG: hypothetical protein MMC33_004188 [Icmadophila ericetorum]|nr:hypothetical protein [Icmadophila ericetorum]